VQIDKPAQGDTALNCGIRVDVEFGETTLNTPDISDKNAFSEPLATITIKSCFLRLCTEGAEIDPEHRIFGASQFGKTEDKISVDTKSKRKTSTGLGGSASAGLSSAGTSNAGMNISAEGRRENQSEVSAQRSHTIAVKAVDPHGAGQWRISENQLSSLTGKYIQSMDDVLCRVRSDDGDFEVNTNLVCYPKDVAVVWERSSIKSILSSASTNHQRLIEIALKKGLMLDEEEPGLLKFASSTLKNGSLDE
jgi:hypothetical protein